MAELSSVKTFDCFLLSPQEVIQTVNKKCVHFTKIHAPWSVLCQYAEELNMRAPLQVKMHFQMLKKSVHFKHLFKELDYSLMGNLDQNSEGRKRTYWGKVGWSHIHIPSINRTLESLEILNLNKILFQANVNPILNWSEHLLQTLRIPNIMSQDVPNKPTDYFTGPFRRSKIHK